jgi:hypothetical protein
MIYADRSDERENAVLATMTTVEDREVDRISDVQQGVAMHAVPIRLLPVVFIVIAGSAIASAGSLHMFELPDHGALALVLPDGWAAKVRQAPNRLPPTIMMRPVADAAGELIVTAVWPIGSATKVPDEATLRSEVEELAKNAASQSVERVLAVQEIKGVDGRGFYFAATDRAPKPGEYKYLTQGIIRVGEIALAFTVLTNDGQEAVVQSALKVLRTAADRPSSLV